MHISELPATDRIASVQSFEEIVNALDTILRELPEEAQHFTHSTPIYGAEQSGRILMVDNLHEAAVPFLDPHNAEDIARELTILSEEARYNSHRPKGSKKGWEIRVGTIGNCPIALIWAVWI